jgi:ArsR family transcriptional regulator
MKLKQTISQLSALAQETRLEVFRELVKAGATGLPAGKIAELVQANSTTLSRHLALMEQAGLLRKERQSRHIIYQVNFGNVQQLFTFLMEDCCAGDPRVLGGCGDKTEEGDGQ